MYVARILFPVRVLGPGDRIGIWVSGCNRGCPGCSNPELWEQRPDQKISVEALSALIHRIAARHQVDGITVTGGEPFDQCRELHALLEQIADVTEDVLIYSGYQLEELTGRSDAAAVLDRTAVLIDGAYIRSLNAAMPLRGSSNQQIHVLHAGIQSRYDAYLQQPDHGIQNFTLGNSVVSVGIHRAEYAEELPRHTAQKGLIVDE